LVENNISDNQYGVPDGDYYQIYLDFLVGLDRQRVLTELSMVGINGGREVMGSLIHLLGLC